MIVADTFTIPLPAPGAAGFIILAALAAMFVLPWHPSRFMRGTEPRPPRRQRRSLSGWWQGDQPSGGGATLPPVPPRQRGRPPAHRPLSGQARGALPPAAGPLVWRPVPATITRPASPAPRISVELAAYYDGKPPVGVPYWDGNGPEPDGQWWDGILWPDRRGRWFNQHDGSCEIDRALRVWRARYPLPFVCTGTAQQADHVDYRHVFHEARSDVRLGCQPCHQLRTQLAHLGVNIYLDAPA